MMSMPVARASSALRLRPPGKSLPSADGFQSNLPSLRRHDPDFVRDGHARLSREVASAEQTSRGRC
jgi:hypothetical protein